MASTIEWTDRHDWNPLRGCSRHSEGCRNCYAEVMAARFSKPGQWGHGFASIVQTPSGPDHRWTGKVELQEDRVTLPLRWATGIPGRSKCFITSTSDPFHESLPDVAIDRMFAVMALRPDWIFQVLTKRSDRMRDYMSRSIGRIGDAVMKIRETELATKLGLGPNGLGPVPHLRPGATWWPLPNVWLGVSVEDQDSADHRIPDLLATEAAIRWISAEPLIAPVDIRKYLQWPGTIANGMDATLDWVVTGGESGPGHRDNDFEANARSLRDQCTAAGVAFFGKQNTGKKPLPSDLQIREFPV